MKFSAKVPCVKELLLLSPEKLQNRFINQAAYFWFNLAIAPKHDNEMNRVPEFFRELLGWFEHRNFDAGAALILLNLCSILGPRTLEDLYKMLPEEEKTVNGFVEWVRLKVDVRDSAARTTAIKEIVLHLEQNLAPTLDPREQAAKDITRPSFAANGWRPTRIQRNDSLPVSEANLDVLRQAELRYVGRNDDEVKRRFTTIDQSVSTITQFITTYSTSSTEAMQSMNRQNVVALTTDEDVTTYAVGMIEANVEDNAEARMAAYSAYHIPHDVELAPSLEIDVTTIAEMELSDALEPVRRENWLVLQEEAILKAEQVIEEQRSDDHYVSFFEDKKLKHSPVKFDVSWDVLEDARNTQGALASYMLSLNSARQSGVYEHFMKLRIPDDFNKAMAIFKKYQGMGVPVAHKVMNYLLAHPSEDGLLDKVCDALPDAKRDLLELINEEALGKAQAAANQVIQFAVEKMLKSVTSSAIKSDPEKQKTLKAGLSRLVAQQQVKPNWFMRILNALRRFFRLSGVTLQEKIDAQIEQLYVSPSKNDIKHLSMAFDSEDPVDKAIARYFHQKMFGDVAQAVPDELVGQYKQQFLPDSVSNDEAQEYIFAAAQNWSQIMQHIARSKTVQDAATDKKKSVRFVEGTKAGMEPAQAQRPRKGAHKPPRRS